MDDEGGGARAAKAPEASGPVVGPSITMWEASLEKLKILNYEDGYCAVRGKKPLNQIHFVFPSPNTSHQFDDFISISEWLFGEITSDPGFFKRDQYDDPNTVANKLLLALRQVDFRLSFPAQKLRQASGENVCSVLDFLCDKALEGKKHKWGAAIYADDSDKLEQAVGNDNDDGDNDDDDIVDDEIGEDEMFDDELGQNQGNTGGADLNDSVLDSSSRQILYGQIDPIEWKIELERVGQKLKTQQVISTNEWRAHVDQTLTSKENIEKILYDTKGDLQSLNHDVTDELNRMKTKEKYMNTQFSMLSNEYKEIKQSLEELETKSNKTNENVAKFTSELAEISEKLEDLKESFESKDSGMHDTSPLVRIKTALQHLKGEISSYDLRIGVVSHSLLMARVNAANRKRIGVAKSAKRRSGKNRKSSNSSSGAIRDGGDDNSSLNSDENDY